MHGRFAQSQTREEYLAYLAEEAERGIDHNPEPIDRYNAVPRTKVLLLSERDEQPHLDPVHWGYASRWRDKPPLANAGIETVATSRMFKFLWGHGKVICFVDGGFEWKREGDKKQPYSIHRKDGKPIFMAAIGSIPFERRDGSEEFLTVTATADRGLVDIHDRWPLALVPEAACERIHQDIGGRETKGITADGTVPADEFIWHCITHVVGNAENQSPELIELLD